MSGKKEKRLRRALHKTYGNELKEIATTRVENWENVQKRALKRKYRVFCVVSGLAVGAIEAGVWVLVSFLTK